jgi:fructokinase
VAAIGSRPPVASVPIVRAGWIAERRLVRGLSAGTLPHERGEWPGTWASSRGGSEMIAVAGEALMDLIIDPLGRIDARVGGGPFNVARTIGRLGQPSAFVGRLSSDRFGQLLRAELDRDRVQVTIAEPVDAPTTLAVVDTDPAGVARYRFYLAGTSSAALNPCHIAAALPSGTAALHIGGLGLAVEPIATSLEHLVAGLPRRIMVMLDPNCRPAVVPSWQEYLDRLDRILPRVDVIKASTEDLGLLFPGMSVEDAASRLLAAGPASAVVSDGPGQVRAFSAGEEIRAEVPNAEVADTVGAGDVLGGAFLAWWVGNGLSAADLRRPAVVHSAIQAAIGAAAVSCTRRGAQPPWPHDLADHPGWHWLAAAARRAEPDGAQGSVRPGPDLAG